jgi:hypothetical protein
LGQNSTIRETQLPSAHMLVYVGMHLDAGLHHFPKNVRQD